MNIINYKERIKIFVYNIKIITIISFPFLDFSLKPPPIKSSIPSQKSLKFASSCPKPPKPAPKGSKFYINFNLTSKTT